MAKGRGGLRLVRRQTELSFECSLTHNIEFVALGDPYGNIWNWSGRKGGDGERRGYQIYTANVLLHYYYYCCSRLPASKTKNKEKGSRQRTDAFNIFVCIKCVPYLSSVRMCSLSELYVCCRMRGFLLYPLCNYLLFARFPYSFLLRLVGCSLDFLSTHRILMHRGFIVRER